MKCSNCSHDKGWHFIDAMGCKGQDICCYRSYYTDDLDCECRKYIIKADSVTTGKWFMKGDSVTNQTY